MEHARTYKQFAFVKIKGVERFEEADLLRGAFLYIDKAHAVKPEGSHFIADLIGMQVQDRQGKRYGTLNDVLQTGATDIYVVAGDCNFLFPAAKHVVLDIDETARVILIDETRLREVAVYD